MDQGIGQSPSDDAPPEPVDARPLGAAWLPRQLLLTGALLAILALGGLALGAPGSAAWILLVTAGTPILSLLLQSVVERLLRPAGPRKSLRSWLMHFQINVFFNFVLATSTVAAFLGCSWLARRFGFELGLFDIRLATGGDLALLMASIWLASIVGDFFFYWYHRWTHVNQFLWQHHKMHHSDPELEAVSTARQNWIEGVFNALFIAAPMVLLFKVDPSNQWEAGMFAGLSASFLITFLTLSHMNVRWQVGWASVFWCSPQIHRIHHSLTPRHIDKNFAFVFPMWDVIFGTYYHPKRDEFPETGVAGEGGLGSFWEAEIYSQREWLKYLGRRGGAPADASR